MNATAPQSVPVRERSPRRHDRGGSSVPYETPPPAKLARRDGQRGGQGHAPTDPGATIRVLVLDDRQGGARLVRRQLQELGRDSVVFRAETESSYLRRLQLGVDVVLARCHLPYFDALRGLSLLRASGADVPFIVLGFPLDDETIVACLRHGATDAVYLDRSARLGATVVRALDERETRRAHRRTELALHQSQLRFSMISELTSDFTYALRVIKGGGLAWEWITEDLGRIDGLALGDLAERSGWTDIVHPADRAILDHHYAVLRAGGASEVEFRITTPTGAVRYLRDHCQALQDDAGTIIYGATKDVTDWKRAGQALRASEERFRRLFEQAADAIILHDRSGALVDANQRACEMLYYSRDELCALNVADLAPALTAARLDALWQQVASGAPTTFDGEHRRKDGSTFDVEVRLTVLESQGQGLLLSTARDVSERRRAERALRASEERHRRIVETAHEGILVTDADDQIVFVNRRVLEILGYEEPELLGRPVVDLLDPDALPSTDARLHDRLHGTRDPFDLRIRRKDGAKRSLIVSASPLLDPDGRVQGTLAMLTDVTELKRVENELFQAQKLESVGRLAAGIAHEINTPIQFIGDNVHFIQEAFTTLWGFAGTLRSLREAAAAGALSPALLDAARVAELDADLEYLGSEVPRAVESLLEGVERVASIVRALKTFAHPDRHEKVAADLNQALRSTLTVARNELKYVADVATDFGDLPPVTCHPGAINQVFLNLLINAAHAIEDRLGASGERGVVRVSTARDGDHALVTIADTGCGIPDAIRAKIFDQFFTTKEIGRGTGQGLALARRVVVDQHGGTLTFESEPGRGTTFYIRLPLAALDRPETMAR